MKRYVFSICLSMFFLFILGCSEHIVQPINDNASSLKKGKNGPGGHTETTVNNLSFPALLADGYNITPITNPNFGTPYFGEFPGLTEAEKSILESNGPWFAQKTEGNIWQADYSYINAIDVDYIDWGDNIESINPKLNRPFRLEIVLFESVNSMNAYKMAVLEYPSSNNELQGTNKVKYSSNWATVASSKAKLVVQKFNPLTSTLIWNTDKWDGAEEPLEISFGVELNIAGKLIYGASQGGWKPTEPGYYRITFYIQNSPINLSNASIGNFVDGEIIPVNNISILAEGGVTLPKVDPTNNLTYVDVEVVTGGGGSGKGKKD